MRLNKQSIVCSAVFRYTKQMEQAKTPEGFPEDVATILEQWSEGHLRRLDGQHIGTISIQLHRIATGEEPTVDIYLLLESFALFCGAASANENDARKVYDYFVGTLGISKVQASVTVAAERYESRSEGEESTSPTADVLQLTGQLIQRLLREKKN